LKNVPTAPPTVSGGLLGELWDTLLEGGGGGGGSGSGSGGDSSSSCASDFAVVDFFLCGNSLPFLRQQTVASFGTLHNDALDLVDESLLATKDYTPLLGLDRDAHSPPKPRPMSWWISTAPWPRSAPIWS